jgi:hypothetical protein
MLNVIVHTFYCSMVLLDHEYVKISSTEYLIKWKLIKTMRLEQLVTVDMLMQGNCFSLQVFRRVSEFIKIFIIFQYFFEFFRKKWTQYIKISRNNGFLSHFDLNF